MTDDLVFRLKQMEEFFYLDYHRIKKISREAADRIEKLEAALLIALGMLSEIGLSSAEKCELAYEHLLKSRSDA